jgi:hypothetical protein
VTTDPQTAARDRIAAALSAMTVVGGTPPTRLVPVIDWGSGKLTRIVGWQPLDDLVDALLAAVPVAAPPTTEQAEARCAVCRRPGDDSHPAVCFPPAPADRAATLREAADRYEEILANADTAADPRYWTAVRDVTLGLRAMADEAEQAGGPSREATETPQTGAASSCVCGEPATPGTVHRADGPRYIAEAPHTETPGGVLVCDGCGHLEHRANKCPATRYGERCACDEPAVVAQPGKENDRG